MNSNLFWCIIGIIGGAIISFIISYFFYSKGIKRKSLIYDVTTTTLIAKKIVQVDGLCIKFKSKQLNNLYISTINIKNNGNTIIEPNDFAPSAPLSLTTDGEFLITSGNEIKIIPENTYNNIHLLMEKDGDNICKEANIQFDFISKKDTILCTVFHTDPCVHISGKIKEGNIRHIGLKTDISLTNASIIGCIFGATITGLLSLVYFLLIST